MTPRSEPTPKAPAPSRAGALPSGWRLPAVLLLGAALAAAVAVAWLRLRGAPPAPPEVALTDADPEVAEAVRAARAGVLSEPRSAAAWGRLGMVLRAHDYGPESSACFAQAERLDPKDPRWPYLRGLTLLLSDPDAGLPLVRRAADLCGDRVSAPRLRLAEALLDRGSLDEAEAEFRRVAGREPDNPRAQLGLARLACLRGDYDASLAHLRRAQASPAAAPPCRRLLAEVRYRQGDVAAARDLGDTGGAFEEPDWPDPFVEEVMQLQVGAGVQIAQAETLLRQGAAPEAVAVLRGTVDQHPDSGPAWLALGRVLIQVKDYPSAETALRSAVRLAPDSAEGWFHLGVALALEEKPAEAAGCFSKAVGLKPDYALAQYNLGQCLKQQGDAVGAAEAFRAALRSRPDYAPAQKELDALQAPPKH
jgi:tetratricopeptide (TPR) repeat protein